MGANKSFADCEQSLKQALGYVAYPETMTSETFYSHSGSEFKMLSHLVDGTPIVVLDKKSNQDQLDETYHPLLERLISTGSQIVEWKCTKDSMSVNCHGFSLMYSKVAFFSSGYIVNGFDDPNTMGFNPMQEALNTYFYQIPEFLKHPNPLQVSNEFIQDGDILVFMDDKSEIIHSGVLVPSENQKGFRILHKLGMGHLLLSPVSQVKEVFKYSKVALWRKAS